MRRCRRESRGSAWANVVGRFGAVLEPYRPDLTDLQVAVRTWPSLELSAVERPIRAVLVWTHLPDLLELSGADLDAALNTSW